MPQRGLIFRVLVASPGDCTEEREVVREVLYSWNAVHSWHTATIIEPVLWETHSKPELGDRPQGIINRQLVANCDVLVGAFWTRMGTNTGKAESGTAEEIQQFYDSGRPVLLYFSARAVPIASIDRRQWNALEKYRDRMRKLGIVWSYNSIEAFREIFRQHISSTMAELLSVGSPERSTGHSPAPAGSSDASTPLSAIVRHIELEWSAERDTEPDSIEAGKAIWAAGLRKLTQFLNENELDQESQTRNVVTNAIRDIRDLTRRELRGDAGRSFQAFWEDGDRILRQLRTHQ